MISEDLNHVLLRQQNRFKLVTYILKLSLLLPNLNFHDCVEKLVDGKVVW